MCGHDYLVVYVLCLDIKPQYQLQPDPNLRVETTILVVISIESPHSHH
jgi:hypothetical protein